LFVSEPELFVVCKSCGSEVSPYVTECPYCGQRVRKRAPKLERGQPKERPPRRIRRPSLGRLRRDEIPGIAPDTRPNATILIVALSLLATVVASTTAVADDFETSLFEMGALYIEPDGEWWRLVTTPFLFDNLGYQFVALAAVGVFGMHLERRFGWFTVIALFLLCGAAGAELAVIADLLPALGANGAALGLLCAWTVDDRMAARRGEDRGNDLMGVAVFAAVLLLLSLAETDASIAAAVGGGVAGAACGLILAAVRR
jgi:membrane associated rhomboid family serine protease